MGALKDFVDKHFSTSTQAYGNDVAIVIGITLLAPNNPDRLMLVAINLSDTDVYVTPDKNPSATHGILLQSGGGTMSMNAAIDGELVGYEWNIYCTAAAKAVYVLVTEGGR